MKPFGLIGTLASKDISLVLFATVDIVEVVVRWRSLSESVSEAMRFLWVKNGS